MPERRLNRAALAAQVGLVALVAGLSLAGCESGHPTAVVPDGANQSSASASRTGDQPISLSPDPRLHQPFAEAIRPEPPADWQRPPDLTLTSKSVGKLYTEVVNKWDSIRFTTETGKPIQYSALLDTELGPIEIALRPDLAPNHVRNFVALALVGYYDGLVFERTVHAKSQEQPEVEVEVIEAGCPIGTGDIGLGSIGYWLKPEFSKEPHDTGTVGACHGEEPDTAACRFYITLNKAPFLDGNFTVFGKVTSGLDIARRIFSLPVRNDPEYPEGDRPEKPVVIRKVTIQTSEAGASHPTP
jgi:cyclophilin family peptidyl-prolyl cis-trans isomerase